jgi:hypothetical protein
MIGLMLAGSSLTVDGLGRHPDAGRAGNSPMRQVHVLPQRTRRQRGAIRRVSDFRHNVAGLQQG